MNSYVQRSGHQSVASPIRASLHSLADCDHSRICEGRVLARLLPGCKVLIAGPNRPLPKLEGIFAARADETAAGLRRFDAAHMQGG